MYGGDVEGGSFSERQRPWDGPSVSYAPAPDRSESVSKPAPSSDWAPSSNGGQASSGRAPPPDPTLTPSRSTHQASSEDASGAAGRRGAFFVRVKLAGSLDSGSFDDSAPSSGPGGGSAGAIVAAAAAYSEGWPGVAASGNAVSGPQSSSPSSQGPALMAPGILQLLVAAGVGLDQPSSGAADGGSDSVLGSGGAGSAGRVGASGSSGGSGGRVPSGTPSSSDTEDEPPGGGGGAFGAGRTDDSPASPPSPPTPASVSFLPPAVC